MSGFPVNIPRGVTVREINVDGPRPTIVVDDERMAERILELNPGAIVHCNTITIPAAEPRPSVKDLLGCGFFQSENRHERRRRAALERKRKP